MTIATDKLGPLLPEQLLQWRTNGYAIVRRFWSAEEVATCKALFDGMAGRGEPVKGHWCPDLTSASPLKRYPRVLHPHCFDDLSKRMLLDERIGAIMRTLLGEEPIAAQSMFYFKPPGAKGQALHQDNYYLRVRPQTCVAAWTAIDRSHPENGGLYVCPGTQDMEVVCPEQADPDESFTTHFVRPPAGITPTPAVLDPGDVLFFNGSIVHGSKPNTSKDEWRRSFICHYAPISAKEINKFYECYRFDGSPYDIEMAKGGGPCGDEFLA